MLFMSAVRAHKFFFSTYSPHFCHIVKTTKIIPLFCTGQTVLSCGLLTEINPGGKNLFSVKSQK